MLSIFQAALPRGIAPGQIKLHCSLLLSISSRACCGIVLSTSDVEFGNICYAVSIENHGADDGNCPQRCVRLVSYSRREIELCQRTFDLLHVSETRQHTFCPSLWRLFQRLLDPLCSQSSRNIDNPMLSVEQSRKNASGNPPWKPRCAAMYSYASENYGSRNRTISEV